MCSSKTCVPPNSVRPNSCAPRIDRSTCVSAAKLTIAAQPLAAWATVSASTMSPSTNSRSHPSRFARFPEYVSLSSTTTSCPPASNRLAKCEPMKPAPPVTRIRIPSYTYDVREATWPQALGSAWGFCVFRGGFMAQVESRNRATSSEETRRAALKRIQDEGVEFVLLWFNDIEGH